MRIIPAGHAGFCSGVENAVELAEKAAEESSPVYTLGELIHNEYVIGKLKKLGVITVNKPTEVPEGASVIIRSHGAAERDYLELKARNCRIIDATCPFVRKIHEIVREHYLKGDGIIIIGERDHPEVIGTNGWCGDSAVIIGGPGETHSFIKDSYCVAVQTTFDFDTFNQIVLELRNCIKIVALYKTICYTTKVRQNEAAELAAKCGVMLVIGGLKSANTRKLYDICKAKCPRTYLITGATDLKSVQFYKKDTVGVTAGASTPKELMTEVINTMVNQQEGTVVAGEVAEVAEPQTAAKAEAAVAATENKPESYTMEDVMRKTSFVKVKEGKRVKGKVIRSGEDGIYVNIAMGKDGFIAKEEVADDYKAADYPAETEIEAIVIPGTSKDFITLSKKRLDQAREEDVKTEEILKGNEFTLACDEVVKGGLVGKMGTYTVFVPASEIRIGYVADLEQYKGKALRLRAIPEKEKAIDDGKKRKPNPKRIVASQKVILLEEKTAKEDHFWAEMIPGNIVEGKVKRYAPFGVFVQVMGFDCLVHISDVSWTKIDDPSKVLKINESYEFEILRADREKGRVSLSYKSLQKTPYELAAIKYPVGAVVKGTVDRIATFGAFIKLDEGVDGLVHVSQICHEWIKDASQALKVGQEVEAKVIKFEDNKITLSIKELLPEPEAVAFEEKKDGAETVESKPGKRGVKKARDGEKVKNTEPDEYREWVGKEDAVTIGDLFAGLKDMVPEDEEK